MKHITKTLFALALSLAFGHSAFAAAVPTVTTNPVSVHYFGSIANSVVTTSDGSVITALGFQYGTTSSYGLNAPMNISSTLTLPAYGYVELPLASTTCGTTYHIRAYATNSTGTGYGADKTFTTSACSAVAPVSTTTVSNITKNSASIIVNVTSNSPTTGQVKWGLTTNYTGISPQNTSAVTPNYTFTVPLTGLACGTTYHYSTYIINSTGPEYGADKTFTTSSGCTLPIVNTVEAQNITKTSATMVMSVSSDGGAPITSYAIQYGKTTSYGSTTAIAVSTSGVNAPFVSGGLGSTTLTCGTTYHYRGYAVNSAGTGYGADKTFKTSACPIGSSFTGTVLSPTVINTLPTTTSTIVLPTTTVLPNANITTLPIVPSTPTVPTVPNTITTIPLAPQLPTIPSTPTTPTIPTITTLTTPINPNNTVIQNIINFNIPDPDTVTVTPNTPPVVIDGGNGGGSSSYNYTSGGSTTTYIPTVTFAPLRPKTKSANVSVLQWVLKVKGSYSGKIDGSYGPKTKTAVKNYQKATKGVLKADGYAGKKTLGHLGIQIKTQ